MGTVRQNQQRTSGLRIEIMDCAVDARHVAKPLSFKRRTGDVSQQESCQTKLYIQMFKMLCYGILQVVC